MVLQSIYEPLFFPYCMVFVPILAPIFLSRGKKMGGGRLVHVDVRKCFDRARHELLMDLLSQHVADEAFLNLIRMFLTNTIMGSDGTI